MRLEKGGKPTVVIATPPFREEVISHSRMHGIPSLTFVVMDEHDLSLIPGGVEKNFEKMLRALTTPAEALQATIPGEVR